MMRVPGIPICRWRRREFRFDFRQRKRLFAPLRDQPQKIASEHELLVRRLQTEQADFFQLHAGM